MATPLPREGIRRTCRTPGTSYRISCMSYVLAALLAAPWEWLIGHRQTETDRYLVEKKHAPLTYDATTITSNLVLPYNAQTQTRPTDHPRHDQRTRPMHACSP